MNLDQSKKVAQETFQAILSFYTKYLKLINKGYKQKVAFSKLIKEFDEIIKLKERNYMES